jgi:hypothetical protein
MLERAPRARVSGAPALLEALDALKVAQSIYQALIEAELTAVITGTAPDPAPSTR